jgi:ubiquinone/menaquinone biosynthesis C-methylase UbiE
MGYQALKSLWQGLAGTPVNGATAVATSSKEVEHWNTIEQATSGGERLFWLQQPRVAWHYEQKSLIDGMLWQYWIPKILGRPAESALEIGCGNGAALVSLLRAPTAQQLVGMDLDESRFTCGRKAIEDGASNIRFIAGDINDCRLDKEAFEVIYTIQAFHHFEKMERIFAEIHDALQPGGWCILDEYVGPARFQWTERQMTLTAQLLGVMPRELRMFTHGAEKRAERRSPVEEVIRVCPSEAIRSQDIVPLFYETFDVIHHLKLGGTIQHILYSGIIHNFRDDDPATDHLIDCIDGLESAFIESGTIDSDFVLLIGRKRG